MPTPEEEHIEEIKKDILFSDFEPQIKSNQLVGNVGLYYICYELSKRDWNVLPTSRIGSRSQNSYDKNK